MIPTLLLITTLALSDASIFRNGFEPTGCPAGRFTYSSVVGYGVYIEGPYRFNVDTTEWTNLWGHKNTTDTMMPWPGRLGSGPSITKFERARFLAAHFFTGSTRMNGSLAYSESMPGPNLDVTIGACGDFNPQPKNPGCVQMNRAKGSDVLTWGFTAPGNPARCAIQANTDYWLNVRMHDPKAVDQCPNIQDPYCAFELAVSFGPAP